MYISSCHDLGGMSNSYWATTIIARSVGRPSPSDAFASAPRALPPPPGHPVAIMGMSKVPWNRENRDNTRVDDHPFHIDGMVIHLIFMGYKQGSTGCHQLDVK